MIFVTVGTHTKCFDRLIKKINSVASNIKENIIIQKGISNFNPDNCNFFDFANSLKEYYNSASLIITHAGAGTVIELLKINKPIIIVPRQKKFKEICDDHQIEFCNKLRKYKSLKIIININELTPELINTYRKKSVYDYSSLNKLQNFLKSIIK